VQGFGRGELKERGENEEGGRTMPPHLALGGAENKDIARKAWAGKSPTAPIVGDFVG
jgi:hypothetical protein